MKRSLFALGSLAVGVGAAYVGACQETETPPATDASADASDAGSGKESGFIDLDAGPGPDAAYTVPALFHGEWDRLPGLEAYPVWTARDPAASATALRWKPCTPVSAGCEELDVDWTSEPFSERIKAYSNDSTPFYKEGRSFFIYQREFPPSGGGPAIASQTVVEELGVGVRFVLGERAPFSAIPVGTFGGGSVGISASPNLARKTYEYAFDIDRKTTENAVWDLTPFGIPEDDLGIPLNYGSRFSHCSGTVPLTTLSDVHTKTIFGIPERRDWVNQRLRADGLFAVNQGLNRLDFIDWSGKVTPVHTPAAGWELYEPAFDRDSNTLVWFEVKEGNQGLSKLFSSPASVGGLTPHLVRTIDLGDPTLATSKPIINSDLVAYALSRKETEIVRISTGETRRISVPDPYQGATPWYIDENTLWEPNVAGVGITTMFRLSWKSAPIVP